MRWRHNNAIQIRISLVVLHACIHEPLVRSQAKPKIVCSATGSTDIDLHQWRKFAVISQWQLTYVITSIRQLTAQLWQTTVSSVVPLTCQIFHNCNSQSKDISTCNFKLNFFLDFLCLPCLVLTLCGLALRSTRMTRPRVQRTSPWRNPSLWI